MDAANLLDEIDGRLTRLTIGWPSASARIWKVQKHVRFALNNPDRVDQRRSVRDARSRMLALGVETVEFRETLAPLIKKTDAWLAGS